MRSHRLLAGLGIALGITLAGALVSATIPDAGGTIHGCYTKSTGTIRVIDNSVTNCKQGETSLSWNVQGPPGPEGPQGAEGPAGPPGAPGEPADDNVVTVAASPAVPENTLALPGLGTVVARCGSDGKAQIVVQSNVGTVGYRRIGGTGFFTTDLNVGLNDDQGTVWVQTTNGSEVWKLDYVVANRTAFPFSPVVLDCAAAATITVVDPA